MWLDNRFSQVGWTTDFSLPPPTILVNSGQTKGRLPTLLCYAPAWERECCFLKTAVKKKQTHERLSISELLETQLPK